MRLLLWMSVAACLAVFRGTVAAPKGAMEEEECEAMVKEAEKEYGYNGCQALEQEKISKDQKKAIKKCCKDHQFLMEIGVCYPGWCGTDENKAIISLISDSMKARRSSSSSKQESDKMSSSTYVEAVGK